MLAGEFQVVNQYLLRDLTSLGLWNEQMKNAILAHNGSIQKIQSIPEDLRGTPSTRMQLSPFLTVALSSVQDCLGNLAKDHH